VASPGKSGRPNREKYTEEAHVRSRYMIELTTPEVEAYLAQGSGIALLPVGSVEMHGPHQPTGTDTLIAKAFALRLAEEADGLVLPEIHYTWAGATDGLAGTISVEPELVQGTVEVVALKAFRMGFRRLVALSVHHLNHYPLYTFARRFYETHHRPVLYVNPLEPFDEDTRAIFGGEYDTSMEASVVLGALSVLGKPALYSEEEMRYADRTPPLPESFRQVARVGAVGFFYQDPRQHCCPSEFVSLAKGLEFIDKQVQHILPGIARLDDYAQDAAAQSNQGWWAPEG
jgi:creatinine amidohydrolase